MLNQYDTTAHPLVRHADHVFRVWENLCQVQQAAREAEWFMIETVSDYRDEISPSEIEQYYKLVAALGITGFSKRWAAAGLPSIQKIRSMVGGAR